MDEMEQKTYEKTREFMRNLFNAGMAVSDTVKEGYTYAREVYGHEVYTLTERYVVFSAEAMTVAAKVLKRVAEELHLDDATARAHAHMMLDKKDDTTGG